MIASKALKVLFAKDCPVIEPMDVGFIRKFNASILEKTLDWAQSISLPSIEGQGLKKLLQLNKVSLQDAITARPLNWGIWLKETDVTKAIRVFLSEDTVLKNQRVGSFLSAFAVDGFGASEDFYVANEHPFKADGDVGRFDIVIAWAKNNQHFDRGLVCEFKLNSAISHQQLLRYENASKVIIKHPEFAFISCAYKKTDFISLKETNQPWTLRLWWKFLRDWENSISDEIDDYEFRQFRATLWEQLACHM